MFFTLSKTLGWFTQPLALVTLGLVATCIFLRLGWHRGGYRLALASMTLLLMGGIAPLGTAVILPLENRFPRPVIDPGTRVDGIVVLGGAESNDITNARGTPTMNEAGERMSEAVSLARRFPNARIVFSGGSASLAGNADYHPDAAEQFFREQGLDPKRLTLEGKSRNTHENAAFTKTLVGPRPGERWLLVTSAFHMPRSMGCFRQAGWDITAWPVDYRTAGSDDLHDVFDNPTEGFRRLDPAIKEWIGLLVYRLTGRTNAVFPGP